MLRLKILTSAIFDFIKLPDFLTSAVLLQVTLVVFITPFLQNFWLPIPLTFMFEFGLQICFIRATLMSVIDIKSVSEVTNHKLGILGEFFFLSYFIICGLRTIWTQIKRVFILKFICRLYTFPQHNVYQHLSIQVVLNIYCKIPLLVILYIKRTLRL